MKCLKVLPNFTILADREKGCGDTLSAVLRCFCDLESDQEHVDTFKITPNSFWRGMNFMPDIDFVKLLENHSEDNLPNPVVSEIENFKRKFGVIVLIGEDSVGVKNKALSKEVMNNDRFKKYIYDQCGDVAFFDGIEIEDLQDMFEHEFGYPIKIHQPKRKTFVLEIHDDRYVYKANDERAALKKLYNKHWALNEKDLRRKLKIRREEITQEDVNQYLDNFFNNPSDRGVHFKINTLPCLSVVQPQEYYNPAC